MSYHEYKMGQVVSSKDYPFYALIQAAMRQADTDNIEKLRIAFPQVDEELTLRYNAPRGLLDGETLGGQ